jgi:glycosyltransferase involved in cell wall biosynthesis
MVRVLHLREREADFETERGSAYLSRELGPGFESQVRTIGPGGDWRGVLAVIRELRREDEFDVVHAWGTRSLMVATMAARGRIVYSPGVGVTQMSARWLRAAMQYCDVHAVSSSATQRRSLLSLGIPLERCHLIRPGVEFAKIRRRRDTELRAALGFAEKDFVLLAAGESTQAASHRDAMWATGILHVLDERYKLLLWGRGQEVGAVRTFNACQRLPGSLQVAEERLARKVEFEELLPATDMILVTARGPVPTLPIAMCMAAGLPIVSAVTYTASELLEDHHTALMTPKGSPRLLAQRVLELRENGDLQWRVSDMARTEAYEYFTLTRFLNQWRTAYEQLAAGAKVEVPEQPAGAGLRFHGRG